MEKARRSVLVVDDNRLMRRMIEDTLSSEMNVLAASNGVEALEILDRSHVDIVLTDLHMPEMDGFALIANLVRERPAIPVIAMTSLPPSVAEASLPGSMPSRVLRKPLDLPALATYLELVLRESMSGRVVGVSLASLLQVLHLERKTCTMRVRAGGHGGTLSLIGGELVDAEAGDLRGLPAALEIVTWSQPAVEMDPVCDAPRTIHLTIPHVLLEAARREDEAHALVTNPEIQLHSTLRQSDGLGEIDGWAEWNDESTPVGERTKSDDSRKPRAAAAEIPPALLDALARAVRLAGAGSASIIDATSGDTVAGGGGDSGARDLPGLLRGADRLAEAVSHGAADEIVVAAGEHYHVLHRLESRRDLCVHLVLKRRPESLVLARNVLARLDADLAKPKAPARERR